MNKDYEIIRKAIYKAISKGWNNLSLRTTVDFNGHLVWIGTNGGMGKAYLLNHILLNADFAQKVWGPLWQEKVKEMMYSEKPIDILKQCLNLP